MKRPLTAWAGRLVQRLEAAGIDLASLTDVVLTRMHMDHVGGLLAEIPSLTFLFRSNFFIS